MTKFRVKVVELSPDFISYAPNQQTAIFYTEMCGFTVKSCKVETINGGAMEGEDKCKQRKN